MSVPQLEVPTRSETDSRPAFFQGVEPRTWTPNRLYRVYVLDSELVFIRAGSAGDIAAAAVPHFGLLGALIAALANPARKNQKRQEEMNNASLEDLIGDHKHNFRASIDDMEEVSLDPPSYWLAAFHSQAVHAGVLRFKQRGGRSVRVAISTMDDMKTAFEALPSVLGDRLTINVAWDERKKRFGRRK